MKFRIYREFGALNSRPIFDAVELGLKALGHISVPKDEDLSVIWSGLWHGRMLPNQKIYEQNCFNHKKTLFIEVGSLLRNITWKIALNQITNKGIFGNLRNLDYDRPKKLGINLDQAKEKTSDDILIACQHDKSLQWEGQPPLVDWINLTVNTIRKYSDRKILIRPHPRCNLRSIPIEGTIITPNKINNTYDNFDINYNHHCVINFNSGPAIQAAIFGVPIICDSSSLAYPVSDQFENIEKITLKPREQWLIEISHTEWTTDEIRSGVPFRRIFENI